MKKSLLVPLLSMCTTIFLLSCHKNGNPVAPSVPSITTQPADQIIAVGTSATFSVTASGTGPMNYQWIKDGAPIDGATSPKYTTPSMLRGGIFHYSVMIINSLGADTSNSASLNVKTSGAVKVYTGKYWDWYADAATWAANEAAVSPGFGLTDSTVNQLDKDWSVDPPKNKLYVYVAAPLGPGTAYSTGDIGDIDKARGKSPSPGIGVPPDLFTGVSYGAVGGTAIVFAVHEIVNQRTANVSVSGWPVDWWADDKSPFPGMTEVHVLTEMNYKVIAVYDDENLGHDPLYIMMKKIQAHYGWGIFTKMFAALRATGASSWSQIDGDTADPSSKLTAYVTAYMVKASGRPISTFSSIVQGILPGYDQSATQAVLNTLK